MASLLSNPSYLVPPVVAVATSFVLAVLVLCKDPKRLTNRVFFLVLLSLVLWGIFCFTMRSSPSVERAAYWDRAMFTAAFAMLIFYYHFTCEYTQASKKLLWAAYSLLVTVGILSSTGLVISHVTLESYGYAPHFLPTIYAISACGSFFLITALLNLVKAYRSASRFEQKTRLAYMVIAIIPIFSLGIFDFFPPLPPIGILGNVLFCLITTIAIMKYHLLDIHLAMRKGLAYVAASGAVASLYIGFLALFNHVLRTTNIPVWAHIVFLIPLAFSLHPLWRRVQRLVDRWFYRERYDFIKELECFTQVAHDISDVNKLASSLVKLVGQALQASGICLLLRSESGDFIQTACAGENNTRLALRRDNAVLRWLQSNTRPLRYEDPTIVPDLGPLTANERDQLKDVGAELLVPLTNKKGEPIGLIVLGKKKSQQPYSGEDERLVVTAADRLAIELENARLYRDALRAREKLEAWLNTMSDCVIIVGTDDTIQFMNKAAEQRFRSVDDSKCWDISAKAGYYPEYLISEHRGRPETVHQYTTRVGDRDYDVVAAPLLNADGTLSMIKVLRDVTERKRSEEREKKLQQELNLSSRLASIGLLAAGVAHEINNPLTAILGFSQRLLRKYHDEEVHEELEMIYHDATRAAKVVQNLLTFARHREPKRQNSDINEILQKTLELRAYELKTSNIEVATEFTSGLPSIMVDFHQIQEVFLNIILNAEQVMTETNRGGKLSIKTEQTQGYIRISFTDNGPGIPADKLDKIFDPFFTLRSERGGTGLGLSISHGIVANHGGKIYAESVVGQGTTFFVELPLTMEKREDARVN